MVMNTKSHEVVIMLDGTQVTGKNAIVESVSMNIDNGFEDDYCPLGNNRIVSIEREKTMRVTIDLICTDFNMECWLDGVQSNKISKKIVDDCTISELLFAVRKKIKMGEN